MEKHTDFLVGQIGGVATSSKMIRYCWLDYLKGQQQDRASSNFDYNL